MAKLVECVPNFSEGTRKDVIDKIVESIKSVAGVKLLDVMSDETQNRTVVTFVAPIETVSQAAFEGIKTAMQLIDLNKHKGEHPRLGATDVVPFIPLGETTTKECVELAHKLGERVVKELNLPVYFYEDAALIPEHKNLADIRKGNFEGLKEIVKTDKKRQPDLGGPELHETAGAVVIGARPFLVAFNVNLNTPDLKIAKAIAKRVRAKSGGLAFVKALGFKTDDENVVQVSMNMVNPKKTPLYRAVELIRAEAKRYGVTIKNTEIVGLTPLDFLLDSLQYYMQLEDFSKDQILDVRLWE